MCNRIFLILAILIFFTSCGLITKSRYTAGYKLNIELLQKDNEKSIQVIAKKKILGKFEKKSLFLSKTTLKKSYLSEFSDKEFNLKKVNEIYFLIKEHNSIQKKVGINKSLIQKDEISIEKNDSLKIRKHPPMEPNAKWAGIIFYGGYLLSYIIAFLGIPFLSILSSIAIIAGFVLAMISYKQYHQKGNPYRGEGLALSIIILFILSFVLALILFLLVLAFFL